jgi:flavin-dependent dehydrogenase
MGHEVVVVDRKRGLWEPVCCTGIIGRECIDAYAIGDNVIHRWSRSARLFSPSGTSLKVWRPTPQAAILDRAGLNVTLASRAQGRGVHYVMDIEVRGLRFSGDRVKIEASRNGEPAGLEARAAVVASGYPSSLSEEAGLGRVADSAVGAQAEVSAPGIEEVEVYSGRGVAPGFFGWLVPTSPGVALVGLLTRREPAAHLEGLISRLMAEGKVTSVNVEPSYRPIPLRPLATTYADRLLVVGSAAGQTKPTTGGGVYYGLLCADIAADHLNRALEADDLSARRLSGYQREWRRDLSRELRMGYWARRVFERLDDDQLDRLFGVLESSGALESLAEAEDLSFDWHGGVVVRAMGYQALLRALLAVGLPAGLRRRLPGMGQGVAAGRPAGHTGGGVVS